MFSNMNIRLILICLSSVMFSVSANNIEKIPKEIERLKTGLSNNIRISSEYLNYDLQYRVYLPKRDSSLTPMPVIYLTDGQGYINNGGLVDILDELIDSNQIEPVIAVFIDPRDPDDTSINRRNEQFFCNQKYINFVNLELIHKIDNTYNTAVSANKRLMWGLSFGGLNAACFGLLSHHTFRNLAIQSPALHPIPNLKSIYKKNPPPPLKVFLSTGTINDGEKVTRRFKAILRSTGHQVKYKSTKQGHNWRNWAPMLDNILLYFYGLPAQ